MTLVRFKLVYLVDLFTMSDGEIRCACRSPRGTVDVEVRRLRKGDSKRFGDDVAEGTTDVVCIATCEIQPEQRIVSALQDIEARRLPLGSIDPSEEAESFNADGSVRSGRGIEFYWLPDWFREFRHSIYLDLNTSATRTIKLARWYCNAYGGHKPFKSEEWLRWSWVGQPWQLMPPYIDMPGSQKVQPLDLTVETQAAICRLMDSPERTEPLGHELLREAWELQRFNPRSALVVGIAAAEAGIKQFIVEVEPGTRWLVENTQSPPLSDLLLHYLPKLLEDHDIRRPAKRPPNNPVMDALKEGVKLRNKVAHGVERPIDRELLARVLLAIRDILWMLDVYRGNDWARQHVRPAILSSWDPDPT